MIDRAHGCDGGQSCDSPLEATLGRHARRRGHDDVGTEGEPRVDASLLVVRGREDPEVDAEGEQEGQEKQAPVDRRAPATCTRKQEPGS